MKILIAGDYAPIGRIKRFIEQNGNNNPLSGVQGLLSAMDYAIVNLEAPIGVGQKIKKSGPHLSSSSRSISILKETGFDCCTIANNHIRDYGDAGVLNTIEKLKHFGLDYVGAGNNLESAQSVLYKKIADQNVAIVNVCENEYSIATTDSAGAAPLDIVTTSLKIKEASKIAPYVIVIVHGGHEHYQYPSPRMVSVYRFFVEMGACAVINHHQHCFSGYEVYKGAPIFYGLGNFCFDYLSKNYESWSYGYMVELRIIKKAVSFELYPYKQCINIVGIELLEGEEKSIFLRRQDDINKVIADPVLLDDKFQVFVKDHKKQSIISLFSPYLSDYARIAAYHHILPCLLPKSKVRAIMNYIKCESHFDETILVLNGLLKK